MGYFGISMEQKNLIELQIRTVTGTLENNDQEKWIIKFLTGTKLKIDWDNYFALNFFGTGNISQYLTGTATAPYDTDPVSQGVQMYNVVR